jgi:transcription initiation factor TFIIIB Brf1 subunit/transcription initiation factor TFIIB
MEEIVAQTGVSDDKMVYHLASLITKRLQLKLSPITPKSIINRIMSQFYWCTFALKQTAFEIIEKIEEYQLLESIPPLHIVSGVVVWAILLTSVKLCKESEVNGTNFASIDSPITTASSMTSLSLPVLPNIDLCSIAKYCFVSMSTMKKMYRDIYDVIHAVIPDSVANVILSPQEAFPSQMDKLLVDGHILTSSSINDWNMKKPFNAGADQTDGCARKRQRT